MSPSGIQVHLVKDDPAKGAARVLPYQGQSYNELKRQCSRQNCLFNDPEFKPTVESLGLFPAWDNFSLRDVVWMRPQDICKPWLPKFVYHGMTVGDVVQKDLTIELIRHLEISCKLKEKVILQHFPGNDCWFLAAAASLTLQQELLKRVVPPDQSFDGGDYAGIFHFRIWQCGQWFDVVVDDWLPTVNGRLCFVHSTDNHEFWMPLLEKAYAKLNGSYRALNVGLMKDAFVDLTGGIAEDIPLMTPPPDLFKNIQEAFSRKALMAAGTGQEIKPSDHLIQRHGYSITGIHELRLGHKEVKLLRLRNPLGFFEWKGDWSDESPLWSKLDPVLRKKLHVIKEDGEFWMQLGDFVKRFNSLDICYLTADKLGEEVVPDSWNCSIYHSCWVKGFSAGGCWTFCNDDTFWMNPRCYVSLRPDPDDGVREHQGQNQKSTLLVSLMQKDWRRHHRQHLIMGLHIFKMPDMHLQQKSTDQRRKLLQNPEMVYQFHATGREIMRRCYLPPGNYMIVPCACEQPRDRVDFTLRIFTKKEHQFWEIDEEITADEKTLQVTRPLGNGQDYSLYNAFKEHAGRDQQVGTAELQRILNRTIDTVSLTSDGFSQEACQKIIQHFSTQGTGKLTLSEFKQLWAKIHDWEGIFTQGDLNRCGSMNVFMIPTILKQAGFTLNKQTTEVLGRKYIKPSRCMAFDDFVSFMVHLESIFRRCKRLDVNGDGVIHMTEKEWMELVTST